MLLMGDMPRWLRWPISRDQWLERFGMRAFPIPQNEISLC